MGRIVSGDQGDVGNSGLIHELQNVTPESKRSCLMECLEKTLSPVLILCEKSEVHNIHEHLFAYGVQSVAIDGEEGQVDREDAISSLETGSTHVIVTTDVALKYLDLPDIEHVICYDMPAHLEAHRHRVGKTRRCIVTTFVYEKDSCSI